MPTPILTVIMCVYNCPSERMLTQAIDSVLNQTFRDFEFLICDDGSTNDSLAWLRKKARQDDRIVLLTNDRNEGLAFALNKCIAHSRGRYIARQDADDYSSPTRLQLQIDFLESHKNIAFLGTDCFLYDKDGIHGEWHMPEYPSARDFLFNSPFVHGSVMFRREAFEKCGLYRTIGKCWKYEDYDLFMRIYAEGLQGANLNRMLYTFYSEETKNLISFRMRLDEFLVRKEGFRRLGLLPGGWPYVIKPLVLTLIPNKPLNWLKKRRKMQLLSRDPPLSLRAYQIIVNRNSFIKFHYERFVSMNRSLHRRFPVVSWLYLLCLNAESILLRKKKREQSAVRILWRRGSSERVSEEELANQLCQQDVVSFDLFDTLIFRPFAIPADLFYLVGERLNYPDFRTIRMEAERTVRRNLGREVTLHEIYEFLSSKTGVDARLGQETEMAVELDLCSANPYMKRVWNLAHNSGRKIIITSDMYLPLEFIERLLKKNGFEEYSAIFISCEQGAGKYDGQLFEVVKNLLGTDRIAHVGDNIRSDVHAAKKQGIHAIEYKNVNLLGAIDRPPDMSPIIGSAYSGLVNRKLYQGIRSFSPAYQYGYQYGGLLILGFCEYIRKISREKQADKILFFSRDGYIVKKVYDWLFPNSRTEYVYWSRNAAAKLGAELFPDNFMRRFIGQKTGRGIPLYQVMKSIGITEWEFPFSLTEPLTARNVKQVEMFLYEHWNELISSYSGNAAAARQYFSKVLRECKQVITVDCGWAGSCDLILEQLAVKNWDMQCAFTGLLAGSNSFNQTDSDYSEVFLLNGKISAYCFSSSLNRDKYAAHTPAANHNHYFELLFSAPHPSFRDFYLDSEGNCAMEFDQTCENRLYIEEIHRGEWDFIREYVTTFREYPFMRNISGSDAYAPFMDGMRRNLKHIKSIFSECVFDDLTNGVKTRLI